MFSDIYTKLQEVEFTCSASITVTRALSLSTSATASSAMTSARICRQRASRIAEIREMNRINRG